ncbi:phosphatase PAP2 family protein (plasmid) [Rhizobium sullae]|uniref:Phosphatase PAP2 family protein n=1 Tax=Rhizobium sullae TaxID=50338 RepID=A0ABY5XRA2_RHISU|nr:phosphatase PAP2 family protein [Rhizobium sullae]UWU17006.1 phosphatase PAP2 family protein [Rhizobium sullae]
MTEVVISVAASRRPMAWLSVSCGVFAIVAFGIAPALYVRNLSAFALQVVPAAAVLSIAVLLAASIIRQPAVPLSHLAGILRRRGGGVLGIAAWMCIGMAAFWTVKFQIPHVVPFYADPALAAIDRALHFGDPWRWAHSFLPAEAMPSMLIVYFPLWLLAFIGCIALVAFHPSDRLRSRYLLSFAATYVFLGTVVAALGASVGPIFYDRFFDDGRFGDLVATLKQNPGESYLFFVADRLYTAYASGAEDIFAGISAMPSIHVAIATLNALLLAQLSRWLGVVGWTFAALTLFGSIYFGWHYAVDGYVSAAAVFFFWRLFDAPSQNKQSSGVTC